MIHLIKLIKAALFIAMVSSIAVFGQNDPDSTQHMHEMDSTEHMHPQEMMDDSSHHMMDDYSDGHMMHGDEGHMKGDEKSPLIRKGVIDLQKIDENNDGKVYQDHMDWNVISDEPGLCPVCEMKLREVSLEDAAENLKKHGYKVK
jgi:hypothetical protein